MEILLTENSELKVVSDLTGILTMLMKSINGIVTAIVVTPVLILALIFVYPALIFFLFRLKYRSRKALKNIKKEFHSLDYAEAMELYTDTESIIVLLRRILLDENRSKGWLLKPIIRACKAILNYFVEMEEFCRNNIYIDTSKEKYSEEEEKMFYDLEDFFGSDEEKYIQDTFEQLKS